jgi:small subunit ribosomal protein S4
VKKATHGQDKRQKALRSLETRLDNVVYRLGLAHTRALARRLYTDITVNGVKTRVPSYQVKIGDKITIREGSKKQPFQ